MTPEPIQEKSLNFFQRNLKIIISVCILFLLSLITLFSWVHSAHPGDQSELMALFVEFGAVGLVLLMFGTLIDFIVSVFFANLKSNQLAKIASIISTTFILFSLLALLTAGFGYLYYKFF